MEYVNCNLCGGTDSTLLYTLPDLSFGRKEVSATLVKCVSCGLIYQNPRPTLQEMAFHYPPDYELYTSESQAKTSSRLLNRAYQYGMSKRIRFVSRYKRGGRLLDVGCATGTFLNGMRHAGGWELVGVEISEYAARVAREENGLDVREGTLEQAMFPDESFDVVTLWDVLEHLPDPASSLREIHRILKPDGLIVLRVPNARSWDAKLFGGYWAGWEPPRHLYVYTPSTLGILVQRSGFRVLDWSSGIGGYTTFLLSLRFWSNAQKQVSRIRGALIDAAYHPVMRLLTSPIFYLGGVGVRGPLMVVTASKGISNSGSQT